mmetsp:Transcript_102650/g.294112  ORF Transcript_102650/g.294112 Transcript_102650/m.294112 type:complete len:90 (-) Transcript_102650:350-619(-)
MTPPSHRWSMVRKGIWIMSSTTTTTMKTLIQRYLPRLAAVPEAEAARAKAGARIETRHVRRTDAGGGGGGGGAAVVSVVDENAHGLWGC